MPLAAKFEMYVPLSMKGIFFLLVWQYTASGMYTPSVIESKREGVARSVTEGAKKSLLLEEKVARDATDEV